MATQNQDAPVQVETGIAVSAVEAAAQKALVQDIDAVLARLEAGIATERAAMDDLLDRLALKRAA